MKEKTLRTQPNVVFNPHSWPSLKGRIQTFYGRSSPATGGQLLGRKRPFPAERGSRNGFYLEPLR